MLATNLSAAVEPDGWQNLKRFTWDRLYTVVFSDFRCVKGIISSVGPDDLSLQVDSMTHIVISRIQILQVSDRLHQGVFSNRSSWKDVTDANPAGISEDLLIVTKDRTRFRWHKPSVTQNSVIGPRSTIEKADIRFVSSVRTTPLAEGEEYVVEENVPLLAPRTWFHSAFLPKITVTLYDSERIDAGDAMRCHSMAWDGSNLRGIKTNLPSRRP
ncbi:MAG: hypothetical protein NTV52_17065 [Acidobacteria bacterium]|nr:hypothetical protein [Acidobacteriota bacterium]